MTLDYLEFVINRGFLDIVPLSGFRKMWFSKEAAIRFSEVCYKQAGFRFHDIK